MILMLADPPTFSAPPKNDTERLRERIDRFASTLADDFDADKIARAMMVKSADLLLAQGGMMAALWSTQRIADLLAGRWTDETKAQLIETPNR